MNKLIEMLKIANKNEIDNVFDALNELSADLFIGNGDADNPENKNGIEWQIVHELTEIIENELNKIK